MVDKHNKSFFDKKTGMIFDSGPSSSPVIFLTFIKKKEDGSWEKPSQKEGKTVKFSLEDVVFIRRVLSRVKTEWNTTHSFKGQETHISFEWTVSEEKEGLWVKVEGYNAFLTYGEIEVFRALLIHVFQEKIANSTVLPKKIEDLKSSTESKPEQKIQPTLIITEEKIPKEELKETTVLEGRCSSETQKALLIAFEGKKEIWVPKSTIRSSFDPESDDIQKFEIDTWILEKNNLF